MARRSTHVAQHAHDSLSRQKIDHLLLSKDAFAFSKPSLDIATESVDAQHGATTGCLDLSQIFYMQSRGISAAMAKKLYITSKINATMKKTITNTNNTFVDKNR